MDKEKLLRTLSIEEYRKSMALFRSYTGIGIPPDDAVALMYKAAFSAGIAYQQGVSGKNWKCNRAHYLAAAPENHTTEDSGNE